MKAAVLVLSDPRSGSEESLGRLFNALAATHDFKARGEEVTLLFQGAGTRWPGRFDVREHEGRLLILDAVHNAQGMEAFLRTWEARFPGQRAVVLFGACGDKALPEMFRGVAGFAEELVLAQARVRRAAPTELLAEAWVEHGAPGVPVRQAASVAEAWDQAWEAAVHRDLPLVVCGSLYLLGDVLALEDSPGVDA